MKMKEQKSVTIRKTETEEQKRARMTEIVAVLKQVYPQAVCALEADGEGWKLLVMGRLSAQCTDARVNIVCRELFEKYPTAQALADAPIEDIERIVRPCGLYRVKAANIKDVCTILCRDWDGIVPDSMEELLKLPGVGRKIANLLLGDLYHRPAVVADTHCIRICGRLGMYPEELKDPIRVERTLIPLLPPEESSDFCHRIVQFGRDVCTARAPACGDCPLAFACPHGKEH